MDVVAAAAAAAAAGHPPQQQRVQKLLRQGHQFELLQEAKVLCDRQDYVDLTIYCEDGVVRAHQMLLATASPFLKLLFQTSPLYGNDEISLILPETKACLVQALVHFVYTGTVVSKEDHFYSLMKLVYALNINASIEAESTNEKPTTFSAPLVPYTMIESPSKRKFPHQQQVVMPPQQPGQLGTSATLPQTITASLPTQPLVMPALPTQPNPPIVSLPTQPVPPSKMPRMTAPVAATPTQIQQPTLPTQPIPQASVSAASRMPAIQLPTQPVPMGMVNGGASQVTTKTEPSSYIAVDPNTGLSYKVEVPNGAGDASDPLAVIMNETIFTEAAGSQAQALYTTENGQVVYTTTAPPPTISSQPAPTTATAGGSGAVAAAATTPARGKKRKGGQQAQNKENQVVAESVDDMPCAPDDEDINTPYPCEHCNKTIKGRVMLQAHIYQEHYENPEMANMDLGDKHACRVCLKLFTRNSDVKAHILRVHCGDRRYPCTMCGKRFKESTHLRKHLYTHTGERPHYCTLCNKGFQTSSDLKRHKRTRVHQERVEQVTQSGGVVPPDEDDDEDMNKSGWSEGAAEGAAATGGGDAGAPSGQPGAPAAAAASSGTSGPPPITSAQTTSVGPPPITQVTAAAGQKDAVAQALLNSITQPVGSVPSQTPQAASTTPSTSTTAAVAVGGTVSVAGTTGGTYSAATPAASSTIDMKALGTPSTGWNNGTPATATGEAVPAASGNVITTATTATTTTTAAPATTSSSTLDLKAISGGGTLDMNALAPASTAAVSSAPSLPPVATSAPPPITAAPLTVPVATSAAVSAPSTAPGAVAAAVPTKRSSSVDSPSLDEERLTVVENDDSSQDSVPQPPQPPPQQQQPPPQPQPAGTGGGGSGGQQQQQTTVS